MPDLFDAVPEVSPEETRIQGRVLRVRSKNERTGWAAVTFERRTGGQFPAAGQMPGVSEGEALELEGRWGEWRDEPQFLVARIIPNLPYNRDSLISLLAGQSEMIGPQMARRIVDAFGESTLDILDNTPERLAEVPGIGRRRVEALKSAWKKNQGIRRLAHYLQGTSLHNQTMKIWNIYGERSEGVIRTNPYQLAKDVSGIGFKLADEVARKMGITENDPRRVKAGVVHILDDLTHEGHLFVLQQPLEKQTAKLLGVTPLLVSQAITGLEVEGSVSVEVLPTDRAIYLPGLRYAEADSAARILAFLRRDDKPAPPENHDVLLEQFLDRNGLEANLRQRHAIRLAASNRLCVITGGPGTGKTALIRAIIETVAAPEHLSVFLAAPTGRASQHMTETTGMEARTIHRTLNYTPGGVPEFGADNPLPRGLYILDELSMVDMSLFWRFISALPPGARIVFVGDPDQLPSVGPGNVLHELIQSGVVPVAHLVEIYRQTEGSRIAHNARRIHDGLMPEFNTAADAEGDCYFMDTPMVADIPLMVRDLVSRRLPDYYNFNPLRDIVVLSPMRKGPAGSVLLNRVVQNTVNPLRPGEREAQAGGEVFRLRDRVMQLWNNYELGIFNGDIGEVVDMNRAGTQLEVAFGENHFVLMNYLLLQDLVPGYATTIHKSQGSQYPAVVQVIHSTHFVMLQRNLIYTALTRARQVSVTVGNERGIQTAVRNNRIRLRNTRLAARLREGWTEE